MKKALFFILSFIMTAAADGAATVATVNGNPVTDTDITSRVRLMARQGQSGTNNRIQALSNIIDDYVKLSYAENFKATPSDSDTDKELKNLEQHYGALDSATRAMARQAIRAQIAWQIIIGRTVMPTFEVSDEDIRAETAELERQRGLPIEITFLRLLNIPEDVAAKLAPPKSCDDAEDMARALGGAPQKLTAMEYELSEDIRARLVGLPLLTWSARADNSVLLLCRKKTGKEYGKLDEIIKQNATYKKAAAAAAQQLKQLRRKAVVVIMDKAYEKAVK